MAFAISRGSGEIRMTVVQINGSSLVVFAWIASLICVSLWRVFLTLFEVYFDIIITVTVIVTYTVTEWCYKNVYLSFLFLLFTLTAELPARKTVGITDDDDGGEEASTTTSERLSICSTWTDQFYTPVESKNLPRCHFDIVGLQAWK